MGRHVVLAVRMREAPWMVSFSGMLFKGKSHLDICGLDEVECYSELSFLMV